MSPDRTGDAPPGQTASGGPPTAPKGARPAPPEVPAAEKVRPPTQRVGPVRWARENLFSTWYNALYTVVFGAGILYAAYRAARFVLVTGRWEVVSRNLLLFMVFRFPRDELWRLWAAAFLVSVAIGAATGLAASVRRAQAEESDAPPPTLRTTAQRLAPLAAMVAVVLVIAETVTPVLLVAAVGVAGAGAHLAGRRLPIHWRRTVNLGAVAAVVAAYLVITAFGGVGPEGWGGLLLTLMLAAGGILVSFPIGVALALGRRSSLPVVRVVCVAYIELIRGVPLITLLFMAALVIGFFFPEGFTRPSLVPRLLIALVAFTAAYVAEIVRGGLQSVPRGQYEAAQAVGLSPWKATRLVILPQALRAVIPATVGQFISLYKDTSLVTIVGATELLAVAFIVTQQPDFLGQGLFAETLAFVGFIYWVGSYTMSRESQRLERRLGVGER